MHTKLPSGARYLVFGLDQFLLLYFVYSSRKDSDGTVNRLIRTFGDGLYGP